MPEGIIKDNMATKSQINLGTNECCLTRLEALYCAPMSTCLVNRLRLLFYNLVPFLNSYHATIESCSLRTSFSEVL